MFQLDHPSDDLDKDSSLSEIMLLIEMRGGANLDGWSPESSRLLALDMATMVFRRRMAFLSIPDQTALITYFNEARKLVIIDRALELASIQRTLEHHLALARTGVERLVWLVAIDALLPSAYRAALVCVRATLEWDDDVASYICDRLEARLSEGALLALPTSTLFMTA